MMEIIATVVITVLAMLPIVMLLLDRAYSTGWMDGYKQRKAELDCFEAEENRR